MKLRFLPRTNAGRIPLFAPPARRKKLTFSSVWVCVLALALPAPAARAGHDDPASPVKLGPAGRPNIVMIVTDDQGYGDLSAHGHPVLRTPNLDRLHRESVRFTDFHVAPMCVVSRAQLMTGVHNLSSLADTPGEETHLRPNLTTLPEVLRGAGYRTAHFGKWHLGKKAPNRPHDRGFQEAIWFHGAWLPAEQYFDTPLYHGDQLQAHKGFCTDVLFDEALAWIGARAKDAKNHEPFFAYVATNAGHTPLVAPESYTAPFLSQGFSKDDASYLGMIKNLDDNVGRLEALLDSAGLRANTLFVFLSDNGGQSARGVYNAGMRGRKRFYYEGGHRVPLFIRWPAGKLRSGRNVTDLTQVQDLLPTLIDLVGISVPSRTQFEGVSLAPVLRDEAQHLADRTLVVQYPRPNGGKGDAAVLWGRWRLVHDKELYNLDDDPGQTTDIAARHPEIVAKMRTHYERWWSRIEPGLQIKWPDRQKEEKPCYFPPPESEGGWRKLDKPEDIRRLAGMDPEKLADLEQWLLQSDKRDFAAVVIRNGYSVLEVERGNSAKTDTGNVKSVAKAICATVLAIASEQSQQGLTPKKMTFAAAAFDFLPWAKPLSDPRKARITVKQLLNHTSGLTPQSTGVRNEGPWERILGNTEDPKTARLAFDPGSDLDLSTHAFYHAALVCEDVTGLPYDTFAVQMLFEPLGVEKWSFEFFDGGDKIGKHPSHGLGLPARDIARIAYCMLHNGRWQDKQVVPGWFVNETGAPTHSVKGVKQHRNWDAESYTHGWLLPGLLTDGRGRDVPKDARFMPGSGGQLIAFVPSLDLVVARQTGGSGEWQSEEFLRRACAAISQETSACALQAARAHP